MRRVSRPLPCRHGTASEPILNQYYLFRSAQILNKSWTIIERRDGNTGGQVLPFSYGSYWFVWPPFGYGSRTYIRPIERIRSHFRSAEPILNKKCLQGFIPKNTLNLTCLHQWSKLFSFWTSFFFSLLSHIKPVRGQPKLWHAISNPQYSQEICCAQFSLHVDLSWHFRPNK